MYRLLPLRDGSGFFDIVTAGENLGARKLVYLDTSGQWQLADADAAATMPTLGITVGAITGGRTGTVLTYGYIGDASWAWTEGGAIYASTVAGELTQTAPVGPGVIIQPVAIARNSDLILFHGSVAGGNSASNTLEGSTAYVGTDVTKSLFVNYFVTDGVADDVQINAAQAYVVALGGGTVEFERDTFTLADPVIPTGNNVWFKGQGYETLIDGDGLATTEHAFHITGRDHINISNMSIQTQGGGDKTCHCIFIEDGSDHFLIDSVHIIDSDDNGIHVEGTNIVNGAIKNCHVLTADGNGIWVDMDANETISYINIDSNIIESVGGAGIRFEPSGGNNYCTIKRNTVTSATGVGILVDDFANGEIVGNTITLSGQGGIHAIGSDNLNVADNACNLNERNGIFFDQVDKSLVDGNTCNDNDSGDTGTYHGVYTDGSSTDNLITGNITLTNHGHGIWAEGLRNSVIGNTVHENDLDGIRITSGDCLVNDNHVLDNGQEAAETYHGIYLMGSADRCIVSGNHIDGLGDSQEDGIHLSNGATEVLIIGNHCQDGMGSGIALAAANDNCTILSNYLFENDDYGIEISAGTCDGNRVRENTFSGNGTAPVLDSGTGTIFHTKQYYVARDDEDINETPGKSITNGQKAFIAVHAPYGLQQLMKFNIYVIPNATQGAANWDLATSYGAIGEANNVHAETENAATYNVTDLQWFEIEVIALGMFASMTAEDTGGISLTVGTALHDVTVVMAEMYYV